MSSKIDGDTAEKITPPDAQATVGCSESMVTYCALEAPAAFEDAVVTVAYAPAGTSETLWAPLQTFTSEEAWSVPLYRLRTNTTYEYALYAATSADAADVAKVAEGVFATASSGVSWIDEKPHAVVEGDATFPVLYFAAEDRQDYDDFLTMWEGLVAHCHLSMG